MSEKVVKSDAEWREQLSDLAYKVTRKAGTERAFTNDNFPEEAGTFVCACCDTPLFTSDTKFDSGTGWPSFFRPMADAPVGERQEKGWFTQRTEVVCERCDAHLGHVFPDGPQPTGQRYCINGVALKFDKT